MSKREASYASLGTTWRFKRIISPKGVVVFTIKVEDSNYRIIQDGDFWRLDYLGTLGRIWEAVTPTYYTSADEAARDLVTLYKAKKLPGIFQRSLTAETRLRGGLVRLAHAHPERRAALLPLLKD